LSPWWLRPTSEGAEEKDENQDKREQAPASPASREGDAASLPGTEGDAGAPHAEGTTRADHAGQAAAAADAAPTPYPEPYRAFWEPREEVAPRESAAPSAQPAAAAAAPRATSWRSPASEPGQAPESTPLAAGSAGASGTGGVSGPRPLAAQPSSLFEPAEPEPFSSLPALPATDAEADVEGEGEVEGEERDGESRPEVRKKRSRRSRGGRRKNGRAAAAVPGAEPADDDDDDLDDELPAQQFPTQPPAPLPLVPRITRSGESYVISGSDLDPSSREIIISVPDRQRPQHEERKIAVFCDFENIALGVRDSEISKFDIGLILERLLEKGKIIVKKAYADWERYSDYKRPFHEAAIELIDIPQKFYSGKNSADIKMVVDAMDLSYSKEHLDTFVILSGDSDFSPLVSKLKENNKYVIGIGVKNSSSNLLVDNCDEFIYYEDIWRDAQKGPKLDGLSKKTAEAFSLMVESIQALVRENKDVLWGSMIKQTMQRKKPSFNEGYYGYSTFSELLEDAERKNIVKLKKDQRSGTYIVTGFAKSGDAGPGRRQA
jgi:uncharacterized protein (TIGR00288 family)